MSNVVPFNPQLPAFLQNSALFGGNDAVAGGISSGSPPHISIKGSRFRLIDGDSERVVNALNLDVVIVGGNPVVSKIYYAGAYDPQSEPAAPTCFSDNGTSPSAQASTPQAQFCASCPHNAWGSKFTPSGTAIKACTDVKKVAVILGAETQVINGNMMETVPADGKVYLLRVPAASMKAVAQVARTVKSAGAPLIGLVTRLGFDASTDYPALTFTPQTWVSEDLFRKAQKAAESDETTRAVGLDDTPATGPVAIAHTPQPMVAAPQPAYIPTATTTVSMPPAGTAILAGPAQTLAAPAPFPVQGYAPPNSGPVSPPMEPAPAKRRGRPAKAEVPAPVQGFVPADPATAAFHPTPAGYVAAPPASPAAQVVASPPQTDPKMDSVLDNLFKGQR